MVVARKAFRDVRMATIAVAAVGLAIAFVDILIYPSYKESLENANFGAILEGFLGEAGSFASPEGFLTAEFFSWIPVLLITVAIIGGTAATAGEEGAGTLDLLLSQPVNRRRFVLEKAAGLALSLVVAALACYPGFVLGKAFIPEMTLGYWRILEAVVNMLPVTLLFLALSMWAGATLPGRGSASMLVTGVVVVAYFLNALGAAVDFLETPRKLSPFYWSDGSHVLIHGFDWWRALGLLLVAALFLALAVVNFEHRDISSGRREWSLRGLLRVGRGGGGAEEMAPAGGTGA